MVCNRKFQIIICLSILAAMIFFPVRNFAQENKEIVEHQTVRTVRSPILTGFIRESVSVSFIKRGPKALSEKPYQGAGNSRKSPKKSRCIITIPLLIKSDSSGKILWPRQESSLK